MINLLRGAVSGLLGVTAMVGVITTLRRGLLTSEQLATARTHPEKIVVRGAVLAGLDEPDDQTRRQLGDLIHFGYGAMWGAALAAATKDGDVKIAHGVALATALWAFGFNVLMPVLRVQAGPWTWGKREYVLTTSAHLAYGVVTAGTLRVLRNR